jgi:hypothetical protein
MKPYTLLVQIMSFLLLILAANSYSFAQTVFTYKSPESDTDIRTTYEAAAMKLALDKTVAEFGPYDMQPTPRINTARSVQSIKSNSFQNYFATLGYNEKYSTEDDIIYVRFPVDLGALSYRTCFMPETIKNKVANIRTLADLRKLTMGQGRGWSDAKVLRHNGFQVEEIDAYDQLFKMTAAHRFDLFCRGATEIKGEYDTWKDLKGLAYDRTLLIYYSMPIFFYTNAQNKLAAERLTKGFQKAYADGSLRSLWRSQNQASIDFAQLNKRRIFRLDNPWVKSIDFDYTQYYYQLDVAKTAP